MLKHAHQDFPSDIFLLLEALGADVNVRATDGTSATMKPIDFIGTSMDKKILAFVSMPQLMGNYKFWCDILILFLIISN